MADTVAALPPDFKARVWSSNRTTTYTVRRSGGAFICSCPSHTHRGRCKHVDAIITLLRENRARVVSGALELVAP